MPTIAVRTGVVVVQSGGRNNGEATRDGLPARKAFGGPFKQHTAQGLETIRNAGAAPPQAKHAVCMQEIRSGRPTP